MLIQHLDALGTEGLDDSVEISIIEICFRRTTIKSGKVEVGYDIVHKTRGGTAMFHAVDKIDPSNYVPASPKAREAILAEAQPKWFRGIPLKDGKTQTSSLVKFLALLYRSTWYSSKIGAGILDRDDASARVAALPEPLKLKNLLAENKKGESSAQLPIIGRSRLGWVVLGLKRHCALPDTDLQNSIELTSQILFSTAERPTPRGKSIAEINFQLQTKTGRARNLYGKEQPIEKLASFSPAEAARVYGIYDPVDVQAVNAQFSDLPRYPVKVGENPDKANLLFLSLRPGEAAIVKQTVEQAREAMNLARQQTKKKGEVEDSVQHKAPLLPLVRRRLKVKVLLANFEGTQKSFLLLNQVFPAVPLYYWQILNEELPTIQWRLIEFNNTYRSGPEATRTPSSYLLWTNVFTRALNRENFDPYLVWKHWAGFVKNLPNKQILGDLQSKEWPKASDPIYLTTGLVYLNNLITIVQDENNLDLDATEIRQKAQEMKVSPTVNDTEALVGPIWSELFDWQQDLVHKAHFEVAGGIPEKDMPLYLKGVATGVLLTSLVRQFGKDPIKRRFDYSDGMHLTNLRGKNLVLRFKKALNLYNGLSKSQQSQFYFRFSVLPYVDGMQEISKALAFNNGLLSGIVIRSSSRKSGEAQITDSPNTIR
jgi:hypothetical protein